MRHIPEEELHAYLDPRQVHSAIAEIAVNLLGAERFVLLLRDEGSSPCQVALSEAVSADETPQFAGPTYAGGDPLVDAALVDGALRLGPLPGSHVVVAVPLKIQDEVVGALVVLKLFDRHVVTDLDQVYDEANKVLAESGVLPHIKYVRPARAPSEEPTPDLLGDVGGGETDPLYDEAVAFVIRSRRASISSVQRQLRIGYNRAARLVEEMETAGILSAMSANGSREILVPVSAD